ncbi:MAG: restriction endonuclease subunit S [Thermodesulfobacteriota bacterium]|nr:restriction endonuclease subunit S [Thermodesulfobacteriota bacterium]
MTSDLKPYPRMKDSGVPWLGQVPEHWKVVRLGSLLRERGETNADGEIQEVLSVLKNRGVIPYAEKGNIGNKRSEDITRYKIVRPDDIVVNCMNVIIGSVGLSQYTGCLSPVYYVLTKRSENNIPQYLNACFQTKVFQRSLVCIGKGILAHRMRIPMDSLKCELLPRPPTHEQALIVRFLDHVDRRVRRYARAKRKLIKLLEEQKQAIIHRAVIRGLHPNVRFKPSGIEWLGDIPEHWKVPLLGRLISDIEQGWSPVAAEGELQDSQWAVLTLSSVRRGVFDASAIKPIALHAEVPVEIEVHNGDLLLTRSNTRERVGDVCIVEHVREKTILCDLIYRLSIRLNELDSAFLMYQLLSPVGRLQIERDARGSSGTMPKISQRHIRSWRVPLPPLEEQRDIIAGIRKERGSLDTAIDCARRQVALVREYRTRLIADVVTGKLDVREAVAKLPEESEELEPPKEADDVMEDGEALMDDLEAASMEAANADG